MLRGSSGVAIASALNWYLEHVAGVNVSLPLQPIRLGCRCRRVPEKVRISHPVRIRYFFNYCTFSYSMAWWDWAQWQRMIDWMALKGINTPLAVTGQEAVWRLVLQDLGFSHDQIADFLVGPAYLPWGWMGNIDGLGGPLPDPGSTATSPRAPDPRARARPRHDPGAAGVHRPRAGVHHAGLSRRAHPPDRRLVGRLQRDLVSRSPRPALPALRARGSSSGRPNCSAPTICYAADPFNEIDPPSNDSTFLAGMGRAIYSSMQAVDPDAVWVLQGWFLYYQAKFWREPQARALLGAVPDDRMLVLDLWGDRHPVWQSRQAFYGKPWIWNVLYNFGGKISVNGDLPSIARNLDSALRARPMDGCPASA